MRRTGYHIDELLGAGGMATIYRGTLVGQAGFRRPVAIKVIHDHLANKPEFESMFIREARIAGALRHPNIVSVVDLARDERGRLMLVMELVDGMSLHQLLNRQRRLGRSLVVYIISELLEALSHAHQATIEGETRCVVHRDLSPDNVLISTQGAVKLSDFGLAKVSKQTRITDAGIIKGKPSYMSPEQIFAMELDQRSNLFTVGVLLWEMIAGRPLFKGAEDAADVDIMEQVLDSIIMPPAAIDPDVSTELSDVCMKLLERHRKQRFTTAEQTLAALASCPEFGDASRADLAKAMRDIQHNVRNRPAPTCTANDNDTGPVTITTSGVEIEIDDVDSPGRSAPVLQVSWSTDVDLRELGVGGVKGRPPPPPSASPAPLRPKSPPRRRRQPVNSSVRRSLDVCETPPEPKGVGRRAEASLTPRNVSKPQRYLSFQAVAEERRAQLSPSPRPRSIAELKHLRASARRKRTSLWAVLLTIYGIALICLALYLTTTP